MNQFPLMNFHAYYFVTLPARMDKLILDEF